jgi:hypothetical protein
MGGKCEWVLCEQLENDQPRELARATHVEGLLALYPSGTEFELHGGLQSYDHEEYREALETVEKVAPDS